MYYSIPPGIKTKSQRYSGEFRAAKLSAIADSLHPERLVVRDSDFQNLQIPEAYGYSLGSYGCYRVYSVKGG